MKAKTFFILIFLLIITSSVPAPGQNADFSGEWKLNKEKTVLSGNQLFISKVTIKLKSDSLLTTRVYENGNGEEYPFDENLSLDRKECKIIIYDMPRTTRASKSNSDGSIIIESTTTFNTDNGQENLTSKEIWKVDNEGKILTIGFTNKISGNETTGTYYFSKVK